MSGASRCAEGPAVIVDPYSSGALLAPAFRDAGVPVVALVSAPQPPSVYAASYRPEDFPEIITFTGSHSAVVRRLRELAPRCVLPGCESGVELADAVAPEVVPHVSNVAELAPARRHKGEMARAVQRAGLPIIRQICTADTDEVDAWIASERLDGLDLVIKPPKSASTDGVTRVVKGNGWRETFAGLLGSANRLGLVNDRLVVQEYLTGTEFVVDTFSYDGIHTVTDVCRYRKVFNGPYMAIYDRMDWVSPNDPALEDLITYARGVLDAVGVRWGAAHIEILSTSEGLRLIELGARPHGGGQPRFCRVATGDSQVDRTARFFGHIGPIPTDFELLRHVSVVFLIARSSGVVVNARPLAQVEELESYHYAVIALGEGQRIQMTKDLFGSLDLGFVVLAHERAAQIDADYELVRRLEQAVKVQA
jgi:biotin carboxylase